MVVKIQGFTLVELMISLFLGLMLTTMVIPIFIGNVQTYETAKSIARTQENARMAMSEIARKIRTTGYRGCDSGITSVSNLTGDATFDFDEAVSGQERNNSETIPTVSSSVVSVADAADAITLKQLTLTNSKLAARANAGATTITVTNPDSLSVNDIIFLGDCEVAFMAKITAINSNVITLNAALPTTRSYDAESEIHLFEKTLYFLGTSKNYTNNQGIAPTALWRKINGQNSEELVAGIEDLQFIYGLDSDSDGTANQFVNASSVAGQFADVSVVRFRIAASSLDALAGDAVVQKPFSMTVNIRNR